MKQEQREISISVTSRTSSHRFPSEAWYGPLGLSHYVALDVETTGLDPDRNEIIEVGAVLFKDGEEAACFESLVKPSVPPDSFITELTGITCDELESAPSLDSVRNNLREFLGDYPIVAQNADFDIGFLSSNFGLEFRFTNRMVLDTAMLTRVFFPHFPRFGLSSLCKQFGVSLESHHRAASDARACGLILAQIVERLPDHVWEDLVKGLHRIITPTEHRSVPFFKALTKCAAGILAPQADEDSRDFISLESIPDGVAALSEGGACESALEFFKPRDAQIIMAREVERALSKNEVLIVEAPTGVGKSLGYLAPALSWVLNSEDDERQVIVSSHTRALQEQLCSKDLADLECSLNGRIRSAVLKGRRNYLCLRRFQALWEEADSRLSDGDRLKLLPLIKWAELTRTGDINEIGAFSPETESVLWSYICSDPVSCAGPNCGAHRGDYFRAALDRAQDAHVVFVNHALLTTDAARFLGTKNGSRRLIVDEAHQFERAAVSAATVEFSNQTVRSALSRFSDERAQRGMLSRLFREFSSASENAKTAISSLDRLVKRTFRTSRQAFVTAATIFPPARASERVRLRAASAGQESLSAAFAGLLTELTEILSEADDVARLLRDSNENSKTERERLLEFRSAREQLTTIVEDAQNLLSIGEGSVVWADVFGQGASRTVALSSAPVDVSKFLAESLWPLVDGGVLTSATLSTGGDFRHLVSSLGLDAVDRERLRLTCLASPFDLQSQMTILCPKYLPDTKNASEHIRAVGDMLVSLVAEQTRGTLVLCTSNAAAGELNGRLQPVARKYGRLCMQQTSPGQIPELVRSLRESRNGILIGSMGLWEGIDVVGEALEILVVAKLPFDVPTEPWIQAKSEMISEGGGDAFNQFSLPVCALRLRQGIGRLIRSHTDNGVVIISDARLVGTRYGARIMQSLPVPVKSAESSEDLLQGVAAHFARRNS